MDRISRENIFDQCGNMGKKGTQCCAFGCNKRKYIGSNEENDRSDSEGEEDAESAAKRRFPRTFHGFPSDVERRRAWIENIRREDWTPSKYSKICSDHFLEEHIDRTGQIVRLRENAVPTRFKLFPQHLKRVANNSGLPVEMAERKRPSTSPHILYYHPKMVRLAEAIVKGCQSWKKTENDERERENVELKDTILWEKFPDGWPKIFVQNVKKDCAGRNVIFLGTLHSPDLLFEQLSILYTLPRYLARSFTFILPYFPTGTMERVETEGEVATASTFARLLSATPLCARGPCKILIFDIHALQERFYFTDNVIPRLESAIPLILREMKKPDLTNVSVAFPDEGAFKRFHSMFEKDFPLITCIKIREEGRRSVKIKEGLVTDRHCFIVDDLVMTGGTLIECAKALKSAGASKVSAYVTHAVFPNSSWKKFQSCEVPFDSFYITDSIPHAVDISQHKPFKLLSLCDVISNALLGFDLLRD